MKEIDAAAKFDVERKYALPACLHLPVAARDKESIIRFIGDVVLELSKPNTNRAFLVSVAPPSEINPLLPIWKIERSEILHRTLQVWVHVNYQGYRRAYKKAFPDEDIDTMVLNHIINRRIAILKGFNYLRIVPVSRQVNSSSAFSESWGVTYHSSEYMRKVNKEKQIFIQYADIGDILTMLNMMPGGGVMDTVNDAQRLVREETAN